LALPALDAKGPGRVVARSCGRPSVPCGSADAIELHAARYLLHEFLSPFSNKPAPTPTAAVPRTACASPRGCARVRAVVRARSRSAPASPGSDWADGGLTVEDAVAFAAAPEKRSFSRLSAKAASRKIRWRPAARCRCRR
jgi:hypothetical protein